MLNGKDLLVNALESATANFSVTNEQKRILTFDNTEYNAFLTSFSSPNDIINLSEGMIDKLANNLDINENRQTFIATIKFLKGLAELSQKDGASVQLNSNQLAVIDELKDLIKETIKRNEALISVYNETNEATNGKYIKALALLKSDEIFKVEDYDLIEEVVLKICAKDNGPILEDVMNYLNKTNAPKLKAIYQGEILEPDSLDAIDQSKDIKKLRQEEMKQEEIMSKINVKLSDFIQKSKKRSNNQKGLANAERTQKIKEIFSYLGYNYDKLPGNLKADLLIVDDLKSVDNLAHYLKEKNPIILSKLTEDNLASLIYILIESNQIIIEKVLNELTYVHNLKDDDISRVINLMTTIFGSKYYENFLANSQIISEYKANMSLVINSTLLFFITDNKKIKCGLKLVSKHGANMRVILENCTLALVNDLIQKNLNVLEMYGFNLDEFFIEKESCYALLNCNNLAIKLDSLIEVGLNEYMHSSPSFAGNSFRTLIIKRVYYAFKNELEVWGDNPNNINYQYEELINKSDLVIDDSSISLLIAEHPILEYIDASHRSAIYSATPLALLKRKTELLFEQKIISRLKVCRIFKILTQNGISDKEAMFYGLTYKASLDKDEYALIVTAVESSGEGE